MNTMKFNKEIYSEDTLKKAIRDFKNFNIEFKIVGKYFLCASDSTLPQLFPEFENYMIDIMNTSKK